MISTANIEHGLKVFGRIATAPESTPAARLSMLLDNGSHTIADYAPTLTDSIRADAAGLLSSSTVDRSLVRAHAEQAVAELHRAQQGLASTESLASARSGAAEHTMPPPAAAGPAHAPPMDAAARQLHEFEAAMHGVSYADKQAYWNVFTMRGVPVEVGARQVDELRHAFRSPKDPDLLHQWIFFANRGVDPFVAAGQVRDIARTTSVRLTAFGTNTALMKRWLELHG